MLSKRTKHSIARQINVNLNVNLPFFLIEPDYKWQMEEYPKLPKYEFEEVLLFTLKIDRELITQYFNPRWQKHEKSLIEIYQLCEISQSYKEIAIAALLLVIGPIVQAQAIDIIATTPSKGAIVEKLLPFHRDVEDLLSMLRREVITYSAPLRSLILEEKESIQALLEELTKTIRQYIPDGDKVISSQHSLQSSPVTVAVAQAHDPVIEKEEWNKPKKQISVTVVPSECKKVRNALSSYIDADQAQELKKLLTEGSSAEPICFKASLVMLGEFFRRLKKKGKLEGVNYYTELAKWLSQYFLFWNKDEKKLTPVKEESILKILNGHQEPRFPIPL